MCGVCCVGWVVFVLGVIASYLVVWMWVWLYLVGGGDLWCGGYFNAVLFVVLAAFRGS